MGSPDEPRGQGQALSRALPYALLTAATLAVYLQTLAFDFLWDDVQYVVDNFTIQAISLENLRTIWTTSHLSNYAPLHLQLLALIHAAAGLSPAGFHFAQLALHLTTVLVIYHLLARMESRRVALLAACWFAVFAPNVETVAWVSETKSTLAFILFLLSLSYFVRQREQPRAMDAVWCAVFLILALLAKISIVVAPAIFLAYDLKQPGSLTKAKLRILVPCAVSAVVFAAIHLLSSQQMQGAALERLRDAAILAEGSEVAPVADRYFGGFSTHLLNLPVLLFHYLANALVPHSLSPWQMLPIETAVSLRAVLLWLALGGVLASLAWWKGEWRFWALWFLLFLAPVLQLVPNATWTADRYLYIPALGIFVLISKLFFLGLDRLRHSGRRAAGEAAAMAAVVALLAALGWQALGYAAAWRNDLTLWSHALPRCEASAYCHFQLGEAELAAGVGRPIERFARAVQLRPETTYQLALARALTDQAGDYARANQLYQQMQREGRALPQSAITSIARNYYLAGNYERAGNAIAAGLRMNPDYSSLHIVHGFLLWRENDRDGARRALRQALQLNRANPKAAHPPRFLLDFWQRPAEVGELLRAVGPL